MLNRITKTVLLFAMVMLVAVACKKDDDTDDTGGTTPVEDGTYVTGAATGVPSPGIKGLMSIARNEVVQEDRAELKEIYMAVKAGADGFNIVTVSGSTTKTWGPGADFAEVQAGDLDGDEPTLGLWKGSLVETTDKFTVPADGLYHIAFDEELMVVVMAKVEWGVIGAATPGGWSGSTQLTESAFDLNTISFEATDVTMTKADWKFRYSNGWKIILDADYDLGGGNMGIKVNTNFGGAADALVAGGANIANDVPGKYTVNMTWSLTDGNVATLTKTGDLQTIDYSATELGLVGDGLMVGGVQHNWDETIMLSLPTVENDDYYTWTYEGVEVTTAGSFKIREGQTWDDKVIGFSEVTMAGTAASDFEGNGDGNFVPLADGTYDFELYIDAVTETYTFTVNPAGAAPELYMLGSGCAAGWDNTLALPMTGTNGEYTITTELLGEPNEIKFITTLGQWAPMYGTDGDQTPTAGNLVYRETENDPDPPAIFVPAAAGTYTITANINTLTYTITAK